MIHVAADSYYRSVIYDLDKALSEGYVIYYESVRPDEGGDVWLKRYVTHGAELSANYESLAHLCGLKFQIEYFDLLKADMQANPERHITADVSTGEMKAQFDRLMASNPGFAAQIQAKEANTQSEAKMIGNLNDLNRILGWLKTSTPGQKEIAGTVCRAAISMTTRSADRSNSPLDAVIIDFRNRALADLVMQDPHDRIFTTYGAAHLAGLYSLLRQADPKWKIEAVKWMRPIERTEKLRGRLQLAP